MTRSPIPWLAVAAAVASAGAAAPALTAAAAQAPPPDTAAAEPSLQESVTVRTALRHPELVDGLAFRVEGTVVRTARREVGGGESLTLLVRDAAGDTLGIGGIGTLPVIGSRIAVSGTLRVEGGRVELREGVEPLRLVVVEVPQAVATGRDAVASLEPEGGCRRLPSALQPIACAAADRPLATSFAAVLLLALAGAALWVGRGRTPEDAGEIPLIVPLERGGGGPAADAPAALPAATQPAGAQRPPEPAAATAAVAATDAAKPGARPAPEAPVEAGAEVQSARPGNGRVAMPRILPRHGAHSPPRITQDDEVLQMLPGRLEVIEGPGLGSELRFFRHSSLEVPEITFGRVEGPAYRHVQLAAPTVSRVHARLRFSQRRWRVANLSDINPVVVNDQALGGPDDEFELGDGDRIRIGDFVFRFREGNDGA